MGPEETHSLIVVPVPLPRPPVQPTEAKRSVNQSRAGKLTPWGRQYGQG